MCKHPLIEREEFGGFRGESRDMSRLSRRRIKQLFLSGYKDGLREVDGVMVDGTERVTLVSFKETRG